MYLTKLDSYSFLDVLVYTICRLGIYDCDAMFLG